jgi:hypothetical protein
VGQNVENTIWTRPKKIEAVKRTQKLEHFFKQVGDTKMNHCDNDSTSNNDNKMAMDEHTPIRTVLPVQPV